MFIFMHLFNLDFFVFLHYFAQSFWQEIRSCKSVCTQCVINFLMIYFISSPLLLHLLYQINVIKVWSQSISADRSPPEMPAPSLDTQMYIWGGFIISWTHYSAEGAQVALISSCIIFLLESWTRFDCKFAWDNMALINVLLWCKLSSLIAGRSSQTVEGPAV